MEAKNTIIIVAVLALLIGLTVGYALGLSRADSSVESNTSMMEGNIDRYFIEQMIPHHEGAIAMADIALERSSNPEVRTLAAVIVQAQTEEIVQMRQWYREWFGGEVPDNVGGHAGHGMTGTMQGMEGDLEALQSAEDFDREFASQMIVHHDMAIMMAQMLEASTERPEMKELAQNIVEAQNDEIEIMRQW
ncbi:MAG: DUF305 domain-containing protein [Candidatus Spechtbacterales bacterium]